MLTNHLTTTTIGLTYAISEKPPQIKFPWLNCINPNRKNRTTTGSTFGVASTCSSLVMTLWRLRAVVVWEGDVRGIYAQTCQSPMPAVRAAKLTSCIDNCGFSGIPLRRPSITVAGNVEKQKTIVLTIVSSTIV